MSGYTPLFSSIIASTIWRESKETKILWITMLAMADCRGIVEGSIPGLADMAKITLDECKASLAILMAPDEYSRTKDHDGRRIAEVDGGWQLLNHDKFRDKARNRAEYMRQYRERNHFVTNVTTCNHSVTPVTTCNQPLPPVTAGSPHTQTQTQTQTHTLKQGSDEGVASLDQEYAEIYKTRPLLKRIHAVPMLRGVNLEIFLKCIQRRHPHLDWDKAIKWVCDKAELQTDIQKPGAFLDTYLGIYEKDHIANCTARKQQADRRNEDLKAYVDYVAEMQADYPERIREMQKDMTRIWGPTFLEDAAKLIQVRQNQQRTA